jgi:hypothetical protein
MRPVITVSRRRAAGLTITGGIESVVAGYKIHIFLASGTLTVSGAGEIDVEFDLVGDGGGGGGGYNGAGGGAGRVLNGLIKLSAAAYAVTIGLGGNGHRRNNAPVANGTGSSFIGGSVNLFAPGGGWGAGEDYVSPFTNNLQLANSGGCGGGAARTGNGGAAATGPGLGFRGGNSPNDFTSGAGGGGAEGVGQNATFGAYALGGAGYLSSLSGVLATYAQGGRGAFRAANADGANASDNTGNGGEGGARANGLALGGNGASGILVLRYPI